MTSAPHHHPKHGAKDGAKDATSADAVWVDALFGKNPILLATHKHLLGAPAGGDAPTDPLEIWKKWCAGFTIANGIAGALRTLLQSDKIPISNPNIKKDVLAALYVLNMSLVQVDAAFLSYIKSGGKDVFSITPPPVSAWPAPEQAPTQTSVAYFEAGFDTLAGALSLMSNDIQEKLADHPDMQPLFAVIVTVVNAEDTLIKAMKEVLEPEHPAAVARV